MVYISKCYDTEGYPAALMEGWVSGLNHLSANEANDCRSESSNLSPSANAVQVSSLAEIR